MKALFPGGVGWPVINMAPFIETWEVLAREIPQAHRVWYKKTNQPSSHSHGPVKHGCISNRIVTFQIVRHLLLNHDYGRKNMFELPSVQDAVLWGCEICCRVSYVYQHMWSLAQLSWQSIFRRARFSFEIRITFKHQQCHDWLTYPPGHVPPFKKTKGLIRPYQEKPMVKRWGRRWVGGLAIPMVSICRPKTSIWGWAPICILALDLKSRATRKTSIMLVLSTLVGVKYNPSDILLTSHIFSFLILGAPSSNFEGHSEYVPVHWSIFPVRWRFMSLPGAQSVIHT